MVVHKLPVPEGQHIEAVRSLASKLRIEVRSPSAPDVVHDGVIERSEVAHRHVLRVGAVLGVLHPIARERLVAVAEAYSRVKRLIAWPPLSPSPLAYT